MSFTVGGRGVIRLGDPTTHGGTVIRVSGTVEVDGKPVARPGDLVTCPRCEKTQYLIVEGDSEYTDEGIPVALEGHKTACGAALISSLK